MCKATDYKQVKEKIKVSSVDIIVDKNITKLNMDKGPYYEIKYFDLSDNDWHIGYGSYDLNFVMEWYDTCFEIVEEKKTNTTETIFRKGFDAEPLKIKNDMKDDISDINYSFSAAPLFKSSLSKEASIILVAEYENKKKESMDFMMNETDFKSLVDHMNDVLNYIDERNKVQDNLLSKIEELKKGFEEGDIKEVELNYLNDRPFGEKGKQLHLMVIPKHTHTRKKYYDQFQMVTYLTGVYGIDKEYLDQAFGDLPLVYSPSLQKYGKNYISKRQKEALDQTEQKAVEMKKRWDSILEEHQKKNSKK